MRQGALKITIIYILVSLLWIALSDKALYGFMGVLSPKTVVLLGSIKGFVFVLINGLLLYQLMRRDNKKIAESEKQYRGIYEGNPNPMWIYDIDTLKFISVNDAAVEKYGYTREEFLEMSILEIRPVEDREYIKQAVGEMREGAVKSGVWRHIKKNGAEFYVSLTSHPLDFNGNSCVMTLIQDLTDKVLFERQLENVNHEMEEEKLKLRETQQIAKIAGWEYYVDTKKVEWSDDFYTIINIKHDEDKSPLENYFDYIYPEDRDWAREAFHKLITEGKPLDRVHRITMDNGEIRFIRQLGRLEYKDSKPYRAIGSMQDVTELKQLEQERNAYLLDLDNTINTINEMFFALNHDLEIVNANDKFLKEYHLKRSETIDIKLLDVFPGAENSEFHKAYLRVLQNKEIAKLDVFSKLRQKWFRIAAYPTEKGAAVYLADVSEEKRKDLELKRLAGIITRVNNMVIVLNAKNQIEWVNKAFEEFTGYYLSEIKGASHGSFMRGPKTSAESIKYLNKKQASKEAFAIDLLKYTKAGEEFWVNVEFTPTFDEDKNYTGYIGIYQNITQRKKIYEALLKQNDLLREVVWISSHEVRRPVASILGLIHLLELSGTLEEKEELINLINACAKELDVIVRTINNKVYDDVNLN
ncbi:PAS domain S-box protein [Mucilaginibacter sp. KACC 22063]|uniref:PAS domain S-box protein n=1 Tax=Mucilaginibacter sp. KACC 22063 TaxID=3025666 RepID=UPI002366BBDF|nr:PAS domain S-box protein [Mucilaginibacter sp. KACC 22063]WDF55575.1 PAS domain S-box protein [Mucilaginibacter sp. KACC 22063]